MPPRHAFWLTGWAASLIASVASTVQAQPLVLDEEFNQACHTLAAPVVPVLVPTTPFHCVLVNDDSINAFVTKENIVYLHAGLIRQAKSAAELQGVIAHELSHLAAGHLRQQPEELARAQVLSVAGALLGVGAAAAGAPQAGIALALGGQATGISKFLAHSRTQEAEADRRAVDALHQAGLSAQGMVGLMSTLRTDSQLSYDSPPPYLVTHPLPPERLTNLQSIVSRESSATTPPTTLNFARLQAKVAGLTLPPPEVLRRYPKILPPESRYARALAFAHQSRLADANSMLAPLLKDFPDDPFYAELAAQLAVAEGDFGQANALLSKLVQRTPTALLWRYQLAEVLRNQAQPAQALPHYQTLTRQWGIWDAPWTGLSLVYGQLGQLAQSHLARAEASIAQNNPKAAQQSADLAASYLKTKPDADAQNWLTSLQSRLKP